MKYWLIYGGDEKPEEDQKQPGPRKGKAGHKALETFYSGSTIAEAIKAGTESYGAVTSEDMQAVKALRIVLQNYFSQTVSDGWEIKAVEREYSIGRYKGIIDVIAKHGKRVFMVDHKFQQSTQTNHLHFDPQVSFYLMLAQKLALPVSGLLYNIIPTGLSAKGKPNNPVRTFLQRSKRFLAEYETDLVIQISEMDNFHSNPRPYRNFTKDCVWDCQFYQECLEAMEGIEWQNRPQISKPIRLVS